MAALLRSFYGVLLNPQSYLNLVYLLLAFPLGIFYFVFLVTGLSVGLATTIVWVGFFILAIVAVGWLALAAFERWMAIHILRRPMETVPASTSDMAQAAPAPDTSHRALPSLWERVKRRFFDPVTWTSLFFLFTKFPLGIVSFVAVVCAFAVTLASIVTPLAIQVDDIEVGVWPVDTMAEALLATTIGFALFVPISFHLLNALAAASGWWARRLLVRGA